MAFSVRTLSRRPNLVNAHPPAKFEEQFSFKFRATIAQQLKWHLEPVEHTGHQGTCHHWRRVVTKHIRPFGEVVYKRQQDVPLRRRRKRTSDVDRHTRVCRTPCNDRKVLPTVGTLLSHPCCRTSGTDSILHQKMLPLIPERLCSHAAQSHLLP